MEWPELLRQYTQALHQYTLWMEGGCVGEAPLLVDASQVRGSVPPELRSYAIDLVAQVTSMEEAVASRLSSLRSVAGHPSRVRGHYEDRPTPLYLDALG